MLTSFIIKLFVKDNSSRASTPELRHKYAVVAGFTGIVANILLSLSKLIISLMSGSLAIISDAFNNISDAGANIVSMIGFRMSSKHEDKKHPLGHGRTEYVSALIIDMMIILVGANLLRSAVNKIITPQPVRSGTVVIIILGMSVVVKLWMFFFYRKIGKIINSPSVSATALDSLSDVASTSMVLLCTILSDKTNLNLDGWTGLIVSGFIVFTGIKATKETIELLIGSSPEPELVSEIYDFIKKYPDIAGVHDLMVHDYGPSKKIITLHAEVSDERDLHHAHDVVDRLERDMEEKFECIATIHLDPITVNDAEIDKMRQFAQLCAKSVNDSFTIHDFRMKENDGTFTLIFDLCIPSDCKLEDNDAAELVAKQISAQNPKCRSVIRAEHPFI
ncbi:MAG: cation transporter [Clostridia bacterium]|nr:cation transporter [Clostridia bacterium]